MMDRFKLAKIIAGPYDPLPEGSRFTLDQIRDHRWTKHLTAGEQARYLVAAKTILRDYDLAPRQRTTVVKRVTKLEQPVLDAYAEYSDDFCPSITTIAIEIQMDARDVRRVIRALTRKGLARLCRGLVKNDDGLFYGSGYQLTAEGRLLATQ